MGAAAGQVCVCLCQCVHERPNGATLKNNSLNYLFLNNVEKSRALVWFDQTCGKMHFILILIRVSEDFLTMIKIKFEPHLVF